MATIKNCIQYKFTNSGAATIAAGTGVQLGTNAFGVAAAAIEPGAEGVLDAVGVYSFPITASNTSKAGAPAYWDASGSKVTPTASGKLLIGVFAADSAAGETSCEVAVFPTAALGG